MNKIMAIGLSIILLAGGVLFFLVQESWIVINFPAQKAMPCSVASESKSVTLWIWQHQKFKHEKTEILYQADVSKTLQQLIDAWFGLLEEENIIKQQILVQCVALCANNQEALISLQHYPFDHQASTYEKYMLIESLLKTIREAQLGIVRIRLLAHHRPLQDEHLNFDIAWPVCGFLSYKS